jgi:hypothetical protein
VSGIQRWGLPTCRQRQTGHGTGERCSRLDLRSCQPGPGYAAQGFRKGGLNMAYGSSITRRQERDGIRATPPQLDIVGFIQSHLRDAHRLGHRLAGLSRRRGWVGGRSSPQPQVKPMGRGLHPAGHRLTRQSGGVYRTTGVGAESNGSAGPLPARKTSRDSASIGGQQQPRTPRIHRQTSHASPALPLTL